MQRNRRQLCFEVADLPDGRAVRDSKHPRELAFSLFHEAEGWRAFVQSIESRELRAEPSRGPWQAFDSLKIRSSDRAHS